MKRSQQGLEVCPCSSCLRAEKHPRNPEASSTGKNRWKIWLWYVFSIFLIPKPFLNFLTCKNHEGVLKKYTDILTISHLSQFLREGFKVWREHNHRSLCHIQGKNIPQTCCPNLLHNPLPDIPLSSWEIWQKTPTQLDRNKLRELIK